MTLPYPESLCHRCAAPPKYVQSGKGSVFILCPLLPHKYPRQPVLSCAYFREAPEPKKDPRVVRPKYR
jgi:hypothetical protein